MTDPAGDDRVVDSLLSAARTATANSAPDSAAAYLRRALSEPPSGQLRPDILLELGFAESYAGDPQAAAHLEAALDIASATTAQVSITLVLGRIVQIGGRNRESLEVFDQTRARLGATDRSAALTLEGAPPSERPSSTRRPPTMPHSGSPVSAGWPRNSPTFRRGCSAFWRSQSRTRTSRRT